MLRPSRPMIRPFMSSDASSTTLTVVSAVWLAATRWSASATRARALRFGVDTRLLLELAHCSGELMANEVLRSLEKLRSRLAERQAADALELTQHLVVARLELLLELLRMDLAVGDALLTTRQLVMLRLDRRLLLLHARLRLRALHPRLLGLTFEVSSQLDGLLARLDLGLASRRLGLALGVGEQRTPLILRESQPRGAHRS